MCSSRTPSWRTEASQTIYNKSGDRINYVVFGADDNLLKSVEDGTVAALVVQDPFRIGYDGVKTALAAANGEKVPATAYLEDSFLSPGPRLLMLVECPLPADLAATIRFSPAAASIRSIGSLVGSWLNLNVL